MVYLISYEISDSLFDYTPLIESIKMLGEYQHPMRYLWIVKVEEMDINSISEELKSHFQSKTDHLFITELTSDSKLQGWLPKTFWQWLKQNVR